MAKTTLRRLAAALTLLALCTACTPLTNTGPVPSLPYGGGRQTTPPDEEDEPVSGLSLTVALPGAPTTLDPAYCTGAAGYTLLGHLFEGLYALRAAGDDSASPIPTPAAATGHELSVAADGGAVYTFHLRPGALWSDGVEVTAGDFEYAWKRLATSLPGAPGCGLLAGILNAEQIRLGEMPPAALGVQAPDDTTLVVTLEAEDPGFLARTCLPGLFPVRQDAVERAEYDWSLSDAFFCGNGPYRLAARDSAQIVLRSTEETPSGPSRITFLLNGRAGEAEAHLRLAATGEETTAESGWLYLFTATQTGLPTTEEAALLSALLTSLEPTALAGTVGNTAPVPATFGAAPDDSATNAATTNGAMDTAGEDSTPGGGNTPAAYLHSLQDAAAALAQAGFTAGQGWPENVLLLIPGSEAGAALGEYLTATWRQALGIEVLAATGPPAERDDHPILLQLTYAHHSTATDGIPLLAEQLTYTAAPALQNLLYTPASGFYLGGCTLADAPA